MGNARPADVDAIRESGAGLGGVQQARDTTKSDDESTTSHHGDNAPSGPKF